MKILSALKIKSTTHKPYFDNILTQQLTAFVTILALPRQGIMEKNNRKRMEMKKKPIFIPSTHQIILGLTLIRFVYR
jgi:hypothetical protein